MRVSVAKDFLRLVEQDTRLQAKLDQIQWLPTYVVAIATNLGYFFTESELETAMRELYDAPAEPKKAYTAASRLHQPGSSGFFTGSSR